MPSPNTSPRDREIERFDVGPHPEHPGFSEMHPAEEGPFVRFSDLQAREAGLESLRDAHDGMARTLAAIVEGLDEQGILHTDRHTLVEMERAWRDEDALKDRAEEAEALVAEARAELERRIERAELEGEREDVERLRDFLALLTATPCSDQGGDAA